MVGNAKNPVITPPSYAGLTRVSAGHPDAVPLVADCRVKPGNDGCGG